MIGLALDGARQHQLGHHEITAGLNLAELQHVTDQPTALETARDSVEAARRIGDRGGDVFGLGLIVEICLDSGRWDEAERASTEALDRSLADAQAQMSARFPAVALHALRGNQVAAREHLEAFSGYRDHEDPQVTGTIAAAEALATSGTLSSDVLDGCRRAMSAISEVQGIYHPVFRVVWPLAIDAAMSLDQTDAATELMELVASLPPGHLPPYLHAQLSRYQALLGAARGDTDQVESRLRAAIVQFTELAYPYWKACTQLDLGRWLTEQSRADEAPTLLEEAEATFDRLGAAPKLSETRAVRLNTDVLARRRM